MAGDVSGMTPRLFRPGSAVLRGAAGPGHGLAGLEQRLEAGEDQEPPVLDDLERARTLAAAAEVVADRHRDDLALLLGLPHDEALGLFGEREREAVREHALGRLPARDAALDDGPALLAPEAAATGALAELEAGRHVPVGVPGCGGECVPDVVVGRV